jgi:hypothetical protein
VLLWDGQVILDVELVGLPKFGNLLCTGSVGSRPKWKERRFLERKHVRGKRQLEGGTTRAHVGKT